MAPKLRRILFGSAIAMLAAAGPVAFFDYFLPHHEVLRIIGTQVKRAGSNSNSGATPDVYYIFAEDIETKKPHVFRNEDTGWGFPWYFKFNSADVQAAAQSIADERGTALLTYYGWRIHILSRMPNVTKIVRAAPDEWPIPWFNLALFLVLIAGSVWFALRLRGDRNRRRLAREDPKRPAGIDSVTKERDAG